MVEKLCLFVIVIAVSIFICCVIGIPTFILGCDDVLRPNCLNWYKSNTNVISLYTLVKSCSGPCIRYIESCSSIGSKRTCRTKCGEYSHYP